MITPAADEHRPVYLVENISKHFRTAHAVVHVDAHRAHAHTTGVVNEVVPDPVAAKRPVAARVDRSHVARLLGNVVDFIEFDQMFVTAEQHGTVRMVVNQVVGNAQSDAAHQNRWHVALGPPPLARKVAVLDEVAPGRERLPIATRQHDTSITGVEDVTSHDAVSGTSLDASTPVADVSQLAACQAIVRTALDLDGRSASRFQRQTLYCRVRNLGEPHERLAQQRNEHGGRGGQVCAGRSAGRSCGGQK